MKKLMFLIILSLNFIVTSSIYRTELNKQEVIMMMNYFSRVIEQDILMYDSISMTTIVGLNKNNISYLIEEKNENIEFSLSKSYFSFLKNQDIELVNNYLVVFE